MRLPKYRRHSSDRGFVEYRGKRHYFPGAYNSPESVDAYKRFVRAITVAAPQPELKGRPGEPLTVAQIAEHYLRHVRKWTDKRGKPSAEVYHVEGMLRFLLADHAALPMEEFGPKALKAVRKKMVEARKVRSVVKRVKGKTKRVRVELDEGLSRRYVNDQVKRIGRFFWWAVGEELLPASVADSLRGVRPLTRASQRRDPDEPKARESAPVKPVQPELISEARKFMSPVERGMVDLHTLTGMRPDELCMMRPCDIDRSQKIWEYRPATFKTEERAEARGLDRVYFLGPRAQKIIKPFLDRSATAYLFSPRESRAWYNERQWNNAKTATKRPRKTPRTLGVHFTPSSYRQAVARAARKAQTEHWSPYQIRKLHGTEVRKRFKLEGAQVALGHARADVTQLYAERDYELARRIAAEMG